MGLAQPIVRYTPEEYLERERQATERHQYYQGEIFAMAGGSPAHSLIMANVIGELRSRLKGSACRAYANDLRIGIPRTTLFTYPDASVICGPLELHPLDRLRETVMNPSLVVEVLSPSTEAYDRGAKFESYQQIDSLRGYLLVAQDAPRAEAFLRQADGTWLYVASAGLEAAVMLPYLGIDLALSDLYADVQFPPPVGLGTPD